MTHPKKEWKEEFREGIPPRGMHPGTGDFDEYGHSKTYRFGYKRLIGNEIFTVVDWENIGNFIESLLLHQREEIVNKLEEKKVKIEYCTDKDWENGTVCTSCESGLSERLSEGNIGRIISELESELVGARMVRQIIDNWNFIYKISDNTKRVQMMKEALMGMGFSIEQVNRMLR